MVETLNADVKTAIQSAVREAVQDAMTDIPNTAQVQRMIDSQIAVALSDIGKLVDTRFETYTRASIEPIMQEMKVSLQVFQNMAVKVNAMELCLAGLVGKIDQVLEGFKDIRTRQDRLDAEHEQDRAGLSDLREAQAKDHAAGVELRNDVFGASEPNRPPSFMQIFREENQDTRSLYMNGQAALLARFDAIDQWRAAMEPAIRANTEFREAREAVEHGVKALVGKVPAGVRDFVFRRAFLALVLKILIGGGVFALLNQALEEFFRVYGGDIRLF